MLASSLWVQCGLGIMDLARVRITSTNITFWSLLKSSRLRVLGLTRYYPTNKTVYCAASDDTMFIASCHTLRQRATPIMVPQCTSTSSPGFAGVGVGCRGMW